MPGAEILRRHLLAEEAFEVAVDVVGAEIAPVPSVLICKEFWTAAAPRQQVAHRSQHKIIGERDVAFLTGLGGVVEDHGPILDRDVLLLDRC